MHSEVGAIITIISKRNGQILEYFIQENDLIYLTSKFQKHKSKLRIFTYSNNTRA